MNNIRMTPSRPTGPGAQQSPLDAVSPSTQAFKQPPQSFLTDSENSQSVTEKKNQLRSMKRITTSLLLIAAVIYIVCFLLLENHIGKPYLGYLKAAAEAGMVGGFADWFAVTALFRHPFGLKIPHTAIIPRKKDQIGNALGDFVSSNFLTADNIANKVNSLDLPVRAGDWLKNPQNSQRLGDELSALLTRLIESISDEDAENVIQRNIIDKLTEPEWGPPLGKLLLHLLDEGRHLPLINILIDRAYDWSLDSGDMIDRVVNADMPKWAPKFVNSLLGYKIHSEVVEFTRRVKNDPEHDMRKAMSKFLYDFADDLHNDPQMVAKVESIKQEIMARDEVQKLAHTTWSQAKKMILEALTNPQSALRTRFVRTTSQFGSRLEQDKELQNKLNGWVDKGTRSVVDNYSDQIVSIITETIEKWDSADASENIELHVGKDLQFIRINGTLVGALAGLLIYSISQIIGYFAH